MGTGSTRRAQSVGFTLIELLVVVAIIALLVSILLPSLQKAKEMALRVICGTNFKTTGTAIVLYAGDYNGQVPYENATWKDSVKEGMWLLYPDYLESAESFWCPCDLNNPAPTVIDNNIDNRDNSAMISYIYNLRVVRSAFLYAMGHSNVYSDAEGMSLEQLNGSQCLVIESYGGLLDNTLFVTKYANHALEGGHILWGDMSASWMPAEEWYNENTPVLWSDFRF